MRVWRNGRRRALKMLRRKAWGFESLHPHQLPSKKLTWHDAALAAFFRVLVVVLLLNRPTSAAAELTSRCPDAGKGATQRARIANWVVATTPAGLWRLPPVASIDPRAVDAPKPHPFTPSPVGKSVLRKRSPALTRIFLSASGDSAYPRRRIPARATDERAIPSIRTPERVDFSRAPVPRPQRRTDGHGDANAGIGPAPWQVAVKDISRAEKTKARVI